MPFWKRKTDPEVEAARASAEAALPPGWSIHRSDRETFLVPTGNVITYGISAGGPAGQKALVLAVGEANAYRHLVRLMRGELDTAEGWAVPLDNIEPFKTRTHGHFDIIDDDDPDVIAAKQELDEALPSGWDLYDTNKETYFFPEGFIETCAASARSSGGETILVMGLGEAGAFRQLVRALRGELAQADAWAPPTGRATP